MGSHVISRRDLYEQVWQEPMTKLAKKYGLSDVGLAKLLKKHGIPRPPRGYWAKLQFGYSPKRTPLPNAKDDPQISMRDPNHGAPATPERRTELEGEQEKWQGDDSAISVAEALRGAHSLVSNARDALQSADQSDLGFLIRPEKLALSVHVTRATLRRGIASLLFATLLKAFEKRGYQVAFGPVVTIFGVAVDFGIHEMTEAIRETVDDADLAGWYRFGHSRFREMQITSDQVKSFFGAGSTSSMDETKSTR